MGNVQKHNICISVPSLARCISSLIMKIERNSKHEELPYPGTEPMCFPLQSWKLEKSTTGLYTAEGYGL
jgi:hypothetical protein